MTGAPSARRLEQEVDALICAALKTGVGGKVLVAKGQDQRPFRVDRVVFDDAGYPCEVWFSAPGQPSIWERLTGKPWRDLLRVTRVGGDIRRTTSRLYFEGPRPVHVGFREELGAPRLSRSIATFRYPRGDAADWLRSYDTAS